MYELNFNVKKVLGIISAVFLVIFALVLIFGSMYSVGENQKAVVTTFGNPTSVQGSGLHFKMPIFQDSTKVDTTIQGLTIGYDAKTGESITKESLMITSDYNFVNIDFFVEYRVSDPIKFLYSSKDPVTILKNLAQSYIRDTVGVHTVDDVITTGKNEIQAKIKEELVNRLAKEDIGVQLVNVSIQDSEPPTEDVKNAFKAVETAKQDKETAINNANKYKNEEMPKAEASVNKITSDASAKKEARINEAKGEASRFNDLYAEYKKYPLITKQRMFYEAINQILPDLEVIIDNGNGISKVLPLDEFSSIVTNEAKTEK